MTATSNNRPNVGRTLPPKFNCVGIGREAATNDRQASTTDR